LTIATLVEPLPLEDDNEDDNEDLYACADAVFGASTNGTAASITQKINAAHLLGRLAEAIADTVDAEQLNSYTNVEEVLIGYGDALSAMINIAMRYAEAIQGRPDMFRRPHLSLRVGDYDAAPFPQELVEGSRSATPEEAQILARQTAGYLLRLAEAADQASRAHRAMPFARFFAPDRPISHASVEVRLRRHRERRLLGRLLASTPHDFAILQFLTSQHFARAAHRAIYRAFSDMCRHHEETSPDSIALVLIARNDTSWIGGKPLQLDDSVRRYLEEVVRDACEPDDVLELAHRVASEKPVDTDRPASPVPSSRSPQPLLVADPPTVVGMAAPCPEAANTTTALYRWFDEQDRLLYIGITGNLAVRQDSHGKKSSWTDFAVRSTIERHPTRGHAEKAERLAIETEHPLFNHQYNDTPEARRRLIEYLIERDRLDLLAPAVSRG
jgi:hypothetical protein